MVSEKVGGAEGTKLDDDFRDLERVRQTSEWESKMLDYMNLHTANVNLVKSLFLLLGMS